MTIQTMFRAVALATVLASTSVQANSARPEFCEGLNGQMNEAKVLYYEKSEIDRTHEKDIETAVKWHIGRSVAHVPGVIRESITWMPLAESTKKNAKYGFSSWENFFDGILTQYSSDSYEHRYLVAYKVYMPYPYSKQNEEEILKRLAYCGIKADQR